MQRQTPELEHIFPGHTEMARRMRALDWSCTSLGPPECWPQSLRTCLSTCLDCAFPIVIWWGPKLAILYNDEYCPMLGPKHPDALGQNGATVWAEIWDIIEPMLAQVMERGEATRSRDLLLHIDRGYPEEAYFSFSYSPIHAEEGKIGGVFCPVIETTQKVIGERRLRTLRDLAAGCKGAESETAAYQAAANVLAQNAHDVPFALIYRLDDERSVAILENTAGIEAGTPAAPGRIELTESDTACGWSLNAVAQSGSVTLVEDLRALFPVLPHGAWQVPPQRALVLPVLLPGQERPRAILVAAVSPMRALDEDYRTFFHLLAGQIAAAVADAHALEVERKRAAVLAELDRAKTTFFSNVSHEFRTPITLMLGPLEDLLIQEQGTLSSDAIAALSVALRNGTRLLKLVNTLLDFSRIEAGRIEAHYEPTDLSALTANLASVFRSTIEKAGLQLNVSCPPLPERIYVDRDMWEKIVLNLLSNAFKFTFEGEIAVSLRSCGGYVELSVRDTGVGIAQAELPKMFQRFHRVKNTRSRTHEGTGIGLALVQELVRLHGGSISVQSEEGRGTTFRVSVPRGAEHLPGERAGTTRSLASTSIGAAPFVEEASRWIPETGEEAAGAPLRVAAEITDALLLPGHAKHAVARVLVADDNADMRDYLHRLLDRQYAVESVADGLVALERILAEPPDLVISDVMMPRLDGFGLLAAIRADSRTCAVPVIILSARAGEEARIEGLRAGADDYLIKPFSARELLARVDSQLALARLRKEAETALRFRSEQYATLLNQAPLGVFLVDAELRIREINPVAKPVFGEIAGGVAGRDFDEIMHVLWEKSCADELVRILQHTHATGKPYVALESAQYRLDRGVVEYYEWRLDRITLPDGRFGVVCYFRDISSQVQTRKALQEADRRKDEFLATLAHELRNPLAPLRNGVELLKAVRTDSGAFERTRGMMERQINQMVRLIDDLLEVSRITHGKIVLNPVRVDLASIIHRCIEACRPTLDDMGHELTVDVPAQPIYLEADPVRLTQVLANLVNNACKFTPSGGHIGIRARFDGAGSASEQVAVSVTDSGIGMSTEVLPHVFDLFMQGDSSLERTRGGLGIGLTLVHRLVELHGGTVEARSEGIGRGSEFVIRLPTATERKNLEGMSSSGSEIAGERSGRSILVVDDNRDAADSLALMLASAGSEVRTAYDGAAAVELAATLRPDVVLLDIAMPRLSGYEAARRIREQPGGKDMTLIALTGFGQDSYKQQSDGAGFDAHLVKPIEIPELMKLLNALRLAVPK